MLTTAIGVLEYFSLSLNVQQNKLEYVINKKCFTTSITGVSILECFFFVIYSVEKASQQPKKFRKINSRCLFF
jgi:hypothetical protein